MNLKAMETQSKIPNPKPHESKQDYINRCLLIKSELTAKEVEIYCSKRWDDEINVNFKSKLESKTILK